MQCSFCQKDRLDVTAFVVENIKIPLCLECQRLMIFKLFEICPKCGKIDLVNTDKKPKGISYIILPCFECVERSKKNA